MTDHQSTLSSIFDLVPDERPGDPPAAEARRIDFGNREFFIINRLLNRGDAAAYASNFGLILATINDRPTNVLLREALREMRIESAWIGASDSMREGQWVWETGEPVTFTMWAGGEPNNNSHGSDSRGEDYAVLMSNGFWNDLWDNDYGYTIPSIAQRKNRT